MSERDTHHRPSRRLHHCVAAFGLVLLLGCTSGEGEALPRCISLARGFVPRGTGDGSSSHRIETLLSPGEWVDHGHGLWSQPLTVPALFPPPELDVAPAELRGEGGAIPLTSGARIRRALRALEPGAPPPPVMDVIDPERPGFVLISDRVFLFLEPETGPEGPMRLGYPQILGREVNGVWRVLAEDLEADGIPVQAGEPVRLRVDLPSAAELRFRTLAVTGDGVGRALRFVVRLDDEVLWELRRETDGGVIGEEHVVALPREGRRGGELHFEVEGPAAFTAFLHPRIVPVIGERAAGRPAPPRLPDIVLLLADTYRADNLAAWGGDPRLAPRLNRFAETSRRFLGVRAPATWTLPSLAGMFSGLYPPQCGVESGRDRLGDQARTLAELLHGAGYRTVAITDAGHASWRFGLAQGFEWFEQNREVDFEHTLLSVERQLAADDGRPLFLFVHSLRAHDPYRVSDETCSSLGDDPAFHRDWRELQEEALRRSAEGVRSEPFREDTDSIEAIHARYRGGSVDTDRGFGEVLDRLDRAGVLEDAVVVFTSDHGESFGEHGITAHGTGTWDEQALVPLLIRAPGVSPGEDRTLASLIDLPPTLALLAGIEPWPGWFGRDLLGGEGRGPVFSLMCKAQHPTDEIAIVSEGKKLIFDLKTEPVRLLHAYDLVRDPLEQNDESAAGWARHLAG